MNRRRDQPRTPASVVGAWICCLVLCIYGGTQYVRLKNRQIQTQRQIERVRQDIDKLRYEMTGDGMRIDELLHHVKMTESLRANRSALQPVSSGVIEEVMPAADRVPRRGVAAAAP
ncbi:MAG: hypothetical protein FJ385_02085 [Verrucomicrobia bacterium]|nr:hypothetical protein [Verrucomicrobiota bacterium]